MQVHHVTPMTKLDPGGEPVLDRHIVPALEPAHYGLKMVSVEEDVDVTMHASLRTVEGVHRQPPVDLVEDWSATEPPNDGQDLFSVHPADGVHT